MSPPSSTKLKLLIVDDDVVDRMALKRALDNTAFSTEITEAQEAESAIEKIQQQPLDCIFLDYNLPGKNGLELIRLIRTRGVKTPIIVLTGQGDEQVAVDLMKAGASDYLPKNKLSANGIARLMRSALKVYRAEMRAEQAIRDLRENNAILERTNRQLERQSRHIYRQHLQLQEVTRLKSAFLATMSHELRTPLNAIIGFSQLLLNQAKGPLNEKQHKMIGRIFDNGKNLLDLINDILSFSKIEANRLVLEPEKINLAQQITTTVEELKSLAIEKSIDLDTDLSLDNAIVVNDVVRLRQILVNLLSNAIKFTDSGYVKVIAKDNPERIGENDEIFISVIDTGCGMRPEDYENIFTPFYQADQRTNRKHPGTGLGLAITHSLVRMMNGEITLTSKVEEGTTFTITLPRKVVSDKEPTSIKEFMAIEVPSLQTKEP